MTAAAAELRLMLTDLKHKLLDERGSEGATYEDFEAYVLTALATDKRLQAATELAVVDVLAEKMLDADPALHGTVLGRQRYLTRLTEHVQDDIETASLTAPDEQVQAFAERMLRELPPPEGVTEEDALKVLLPAAAAAHVARARRLQAEADSLMKMLDCARAYGCPDDAAFVPWLIEHGLARKAGDRIELLPAAGPSSPEPTP